MWGWWGECLLLFIFLFVGLVGLFGVVLCNCWNFVDGMCCYFCLFCGVICSIFFSVLIFVVIFCVLDRCRLWVFFLYVWWCRVIRLVLVVISFFRLLLSSMIL